MSDFSAGKYPRVLRATGAVAVASEFAPSTSDAFLVQSFRMNLSAVGGAGNLTITIDSAAGAEYDTIVFTQDMTAVTDISWIPEQPVIVHSDDHVDVAWVNANGRTYGIEFVWSPVG